MTKGTPHLAGDSGRLPRDEPYPGVTRRSFSTERATVTFYEFIPGASFPRHRHPQEQITYVQRGEVRFTVGDAPLQLCAGAWSVVPPDVEHGLEAAEVGAEVLAIVVPAREHIDAFSIVERGDPA
jgi:quercetin dioxygenase-like cupin family protein